jgi:predicted metal-dependent hydrolase
MENEIKTQISILSMLGLEDLAGPFFDAIKPRIFMGTKKKITLRNEKIEYTLRKHRKAKRMKVAIYCDGNCVVTLPWHMGIINAEQFIRQNAEWILEKMKSMKKIGKKSIFAGNDHVEYLKLKEYAREFVNKRLEKYNEIYGCKYKGVAIRNQKTRWGSCSAKGNLNFNYKIILLPPRHADYIIVHELCHLKEFNHGKRFWNLVAQTFPDYEKIVEQLRLL